MECYHITLKNFAFFLEYYIYKKKYNKPFTSKNNIINYYKEKKVYFIWQVKHTHTITHKKNPVKDIFMHG